MVHLVVHIVREIKLCGPVFLRWAYPFERHMVTLKDKVKNPAHPEGSIIQGITTEEVGEFVAEFMAKGEPIGLSKSRHEGRLDGHGVVGAKDVSVPAVKQNQAHLFVLHHLIEVHPHLEKHMTELRMKNLSKGERALMQEHNRSFVDWFHAEVMRELSESDHDISETVKWLAYGPRSSIKTFQGYDINGYTFCTKRQDRKSRSIWNSGVSVVASSREYASAKDKTPVGASLSYYGIIQEIWELEYSTFKVPLFQCKWVSRRGSVQKDDCGFIVVDITRMRETDEPLILASQAKQIFYIKDTKNPQWDVVVPGKRQILGVGDVEDEEEYDAFDDLPPFSIPTNDDMEEIELETNYARIDHQEGHIVDE